MSLETITDETTLSVGSGTLLRKMDCGCITFAEPIRENEYLVIRSCDDSPYDYEPDGDLGFFVRPFRDDQVKESELVPAIDVWKSMNKLMNNGIIARRMKRSIESLLRL